MTGFARDPNSIYPISVSVIAAVGHAGTVNGASIDTGLKTETVRAVGLIDNGTDFRIDLEHSDDDATWRVLATGVAQTAPMGADQNTQFSTAFDTTVDVAGTSGIDRYVRAVLVVLSGTVDGAVGLEQFARHTT